MLTKHIKPSQLPTVLRLNRLSKFPRNKSSVGAFADDKPPSSVNGLHQPNSWKMPHLTKIDNTAPLSNVSERHWDAKWEDVAELKQLAAKHSAATWGPSSIVGNLPLMTQGEGVYLIDSDGKRYMDWTSQAICTNLGHTVPKEISEAMMAQLNSVPFVYSGQALTEQRVRLATLMSELCPADINSFLFPSGGAEANEAAIRIARRITGKHKIINQYRSYHGGTSSTLSATGDFRRWFAEQGGNGFVKAYNPQPYNFQWGATEEEIVETSLAALEEQLMWEGPGTIAAVMIESVVGSGGVLINPPGYMEGVRALCDKHGILLILDEVMVGFGRTGTFWGFQHYEGVVPDIVTSAKGLSAAWQPIAMVGMRQHIRDFFEHEPLGWGATFHAHPVAVSCAYGVLKHMIKNDILGNAQRLAPIFKEGVERLVDNHSAVRQGRALGMFGCLDLVDSEGQYIQDMNRPNPATADKVAAFRKRLLDNGVIGLIRPPYLHCAPALNITESELMDGFERVDDALCALDH